MLNKQQQQRAAKAISSRTAWTGTAEKHENVSNPCQSEEVKLTVEFRKCYLNFNPSVEP